jgi:hypothetical protein
VGGLATLALNVGSRLILGHTWLGLALIVGPRSVERGALFGHWEYHTFISEHGLPSLAKGLSYPR